MQKRVILLNGPSSSGKSTLARTLQTRMRQTRNEDWPVLSIDDFMRVETDCPIYEDDVYEINADLCGAAAAALSSAPGVIVDHVITSERIDRQCRDAFSDARLVCVHVVCPLAVLKARELARKDRYVGSAEASLTYLYPKDGYDCTVDTHTMLPDACADEIVRFVFSEETT